MSQLPAVRQDELEACRRGPFLQLTIAGHLVWYTCPVAVARELALRALAGCAWDLDAEERERQGDGSDDEL